MKWVSVTFFLAISLLMQAPEVENENIYLQAVRHYEREKFLSSLDTLPFTVENLYRALNYLEISQPETLVKQAILETGNFSSYLWVTYNNPFGMKHPVVRPTTSNGPVTRLRYASYDHWSDSVRDMIYFQQWYVERGWDLECIDEYKRFLLALYAEDRYYVRKLLTINIEAS